MKKRIFSALLALCLMLTLLPAAALAEVSFGSFTSGGADIDMSSGEGGDAPSGGQSGGEDGDGPSDGTGGGIYEERSSSGGGVYIPGGEDGGNGGGKTGNGDSSTDGNVNADGGDRAGNASGGAANAGFGGLTEYELELLESDQSLLSLDEQAAYLAAAEKYIALYGGHGIALFGGDETESGGEESGPVFLISNAAQLADLALKISSCAAYGDGLEWRGASFRQVADIDLSAYAPGAEVNGVSYPDGWLPIGTDSWGYSFNQEQTRRLFTGSYDGSGFEISGLVIKNSGSSYRAAAGLFGCVSGASVKNIILTDCRVTSSGCVGGISAHAMNSSIENCAVTGELLGLKASGITAAAGGITGGCAYSSVIGCSFSGSVDAGSAGGIAGDGSEIGVSGDGSTVIAACSVTGEIRSPESAGGICSFTTDSAVIYGCFVSADVTAYGGDESDTAGGIIASVSGSAVYGCYAAGTVSSTGGAAGGIVGQLKNGARLVGCVALHRTVTGYRSGAILSMVNLISGSHDGCGSWSGTAVTAAGEVVDTTSDGALTLDAAGLTRQLEEFLSPALEQAGLNDPYTYADDRLPGFGRTYPLPDYMTASPAPGRSAAVSSAADLAELARGISSGEPFSYKGLEIPAGGQGWVFTQTGDIDLSGYSPNAEVDGVPYPNGWVPIGSGEIDPSGDGFTGMPFMGTYDGGGFYIDSLHILDNESGASAGLFGGIASCGTVKNVNISQFTITGSGLCAGGIAAWVGGSIENCSVSGSLDGGGQQNSSEARFGGVAGIISGGSVTGCSFVGTVNGELAGGIAYRASGAVISSCRAEAEIQGSTLAGGIAAIADGQSLIFACSADADVRAVYEDENSAFAGGIAGAGEGCSIVSCYAAGTVSAPHGTAAGILADPRQGHSSIITGCAALQKSIEAPAAADICPGEAPDGSAAVSGCGVWAGIGFGGAEPIRAAGAESFRRTVSGLTMQLEDILAPAAADEGQDDPYTYADNRLPGFGRTYPLPDYMTEEQAQAAGTVHISSAADLAALAAGVGSGRAFKLHGSTVAAYAMGWTFIQDADIDLSAYAPGAVVDGVSYPDGWRPIGRDVSSEDTRFFGGTYDGQGFEISGMTISASAEEETYYLGLFGGIGPSGAVKNVVLTGCSIAASGGASSCWYAGGIAGSSLGEISGCSVAGNISAPDCAGGIVGWNRVSGTVSGCSVAGKVSDADYAGGIVGHNFGGGTVSGCHFKGSVNTFGDCAGGIVGSVTGDDYPGIGSITGCGADGDISGCWSGGIAGLLDGGNISACHSSGSVASVSSSGGGIVGRIGDEGSGGTVSDCLSYADVTAALAGGIAGSLKTGGIERCIYLGGSVKSGMAAAAGIAGIFTEGTYIRSCLMLGGSLSGQEESGRIAFAFDPGELADNYVLVSGGEISLTDAAGCDGADLLTAGGRLYSDGKFRHRLELASMLYSDELWQDLDTPGYFPTLKCMDRRSMSLDQQAAEEKITEITLTPDVCTLPSRTRGYWRSPSAVITVSNTGNVDLESFEADVTGSGFSVSFGGGAIAAGDSAEITVTPELGLRVGTHTAVITVTTPEGAEAQAEVSFTVEPYAGSGSGWADEFVLSFDTMGGGDMDSVTVRPGDTVDLSDYVPERRGYVFTGWYADRSLTVPVDSVRMTGSMTVFAAWAARDGGDVSGSFADVSGGDWFAEDVSWVYGAGLMDGVGGGLFDPYGAVTRAMAAVILHRMALSPAPDGDASALFSDVAAGAWYTEAVGWCTEQGLFTGYGDGSFGPNDPLSRQQLAAVLYRWAVRSGVDVSVGEDTNILSYTDALDVDEYAVEAMQWCCGAGLIQGSGGMLMPRDGASRAQLAAILHRYAALSAGE